MDSPSYPQWSDDDERGDTQTQHSLDNLADSVLRVWQCPECQKIVLYERSKEHLAECQKEQQSSQADAQAQTGRQRRLKRKAGWDEEDVDGEGDDEDDEIEEEDRRMNGAERNGMESLQGNGQRPKRRDEEDDDEDGDDDEEEDDRDDDESGSQSPSNKTSIMIITTGEDGVNGKQRRLGKTKTGPGGRQNEPLNVDRQCGVVNPEGGPCRRSLTCKSHSMGAKRGVPGRSAPYDVLLNQWMDAHGIKRPGAANKERAAAAARARRLEAADEGGSQSSDGEAGSEEDLERLPAMGFSAFGSGGMDSDDDLDNVLTSIRIAVKRPLPIVWSHLTTSKRAWFVDRRYTGRAARTALIAALRDSRPLASHPRTSLDHQAQAHAPNMALAEPNALQSFTQNPPQTTLSNPYSTVGMNPILTSTVSNKSKPPATLEPQKMTVQ